MKKRVLITGSKGFIGRHLAHFLSQLGFEVNGLGHGEFSEAEKTQWGLSHWVQNDVTFNSLMKFGGEPDFVFHCAGGSSVGLSLKDPDLDYKRTVETTKDVLEFVKAKGNKARVVIPSSAAVYGITDNKPILENQKLKPVSPYGENKLKAESLSRIYATNFEVKVIIVRLFSVYGAGLKKQLLYDACEKIKANDISFFGTGTETRDWLHVKDASEILMEAALKASTDCPIINGGTGVAPTNAEVLKEVFNHFKRGDSPVFLNEKKAGDPPHYQADTTALKDWGWKPKIPWRQGVQEYCNWYTESC